MNFNSLVDEYLGYLQSGISINQLLDIMKYDYNLFIKKKNKLIDEDTYTNIKSIDDASIKFKALKKAYSILTFPGYQLVFTRKIKNTTLD